MQRWLVAVLLLVLVAVPARADNATVSLGSTVLDLPVGQVVPLNVTVTDIEGLYGFELHLAFDPALLEVGDADAGTPGVQLQVGDFIPADFVAQNRADNQSGTADFAVTQLSPREPKSGSGTLVTVLLRGRAAGRNSRVEATQVLLADQDGMVLPVSVLGGDVRVLAAGAQLPTETATTTSSPVNATPTQTVDVPAAATSTATRASVTPSLTSTARPGAPTQASTQGLSPSTPAPPVAIVSMPTPADRVASTVAVGAVQRPPETVAPAAATTSMLASAPDSSARTPAVNPTRPDPSATPQVVARAAAASSGKSILPSQAASGGNAGNERSEPTAPGREGLLIGAVAILAIALLGGAGLFVFAALGRRR